MITSNSYFGMIHPNLPEIRPSVSRLQNQSVTFGDCDLSKAIAEKHHFQPKGLSELWDFFGLTGKSRPTKLQTGRAPSQHRLNPLGRSRAFSKL
jgi:hypothetical protein